MIDGWNEETRRWMLMGTQTSFAYAKIKQRILATIKDGSIPPSQRLDKIAKILNEDTLVKLEVLRHTDWWMTTGSIELQTFDKAWLQETIKLYEGFAKEKGLL